MDTGHNMVAIAQEVEAVAMLAIVVMVGGTAAAAALTIGHRLLAKAKIHLPNVRGIGGSMPEQITTVNVVSMATTVGVWTRPNSAVPSASGVRCPSMGYGYRHIAR